MPVKGVNQDVFHVNINEVEQSMVTRLKGHYGFKTDKELFVALLKRAHMALPVKKTRKRG